MYLPIVGLAIAVSASLAQLPIPTHRLAWTFTACSVFAFFATAHRAQVWSDGVSFWQDVVAKSPRKARGYPHLTHTYVAARRCEEAINHLERVKDVMPRDYFILVNWAQAYTCAALAKLQEAEKLMPSADVYGMMGGILAEQGRTAEAEEAFTKAVAKEPPGTDLSHVYLGNLALLANNRIRAEEEYRRALAVNPYSPEAVSQLRRLDIAASREDRSRSVVPADSNVWPLRLPGQFVDRRMP
jgi:tetratricopeptide (TPR) repeat protein